MNIFDSMNRAFNDMESYISSKIAPFLLDEKTMRHFRPEEIYEVKNYIINKKSRNKIKDDLFDRFFKNPYAGTLYAINVDPSATTSDGKTIEDLMREDTSFSPLMILDYIINVKNSRWDVFEDRVLDEFRRGSHEAGALAFYYLDKYLNNQRWKELEDLLIDLYKSNHYDFDIIAYYIAKVLHNSRWVEIEPIIKEKYIKDNNSKDWNLYRSIISGKPYVYTKPDAAETKQNSDAMLEAYKQNKVGYEQMADYARKYLNNKWDDFGQAILDKYTSGYNNFNEIRKYIINFNNKQRWADFETILHDKLQRDISNSSTRKHLVEYASLIDGQSQQYFDTLKKFILNSYKNNLMPYHYVMNYALKFQQKLNQNWQELEDYLINNFTSDSTFKDAYTYGTVFKNNDWKELKDRAIALYKNGDISFNTIKTLCGKQPWDELRDELIKKYKTDPDVAKDIIVYADITKDPNTLDSLNQVMLDGYKNGIFDYNQVYNYIQTFKITDANFLKEFKNYIKATKNKSDKISYLLDNGAVTKQDYQALINAFNKDIIDFKTIEKYIEKFGFNIAFAQPILDKYMNGKLKFEDIQPYIEPYASNTNTHSWNALRDAIIDKGDYESLITYFGIVGLPGNKINSFKKAYLNKYKKDNDFEFIENVIVKNLQGQPWKELEDFLKAENKIKELLDYVRLVIGTIKDKDLKSIEDYILNYIDPLKPSQKSEIISNYKQILESAGKSCFDAYLKNTPKEDLYLNEEDLAKKDIDLNELNYIKFLDDISRVASSTLTEPEKLQLGLQLGKLVYNFNVAQGSKQFNENNKFYRYIKNKCLDFGSRHDIEEIIKNSIKNKIKEYDTKNKSKVNKIELDLILDEICNLGSVLYDVYGNNHYAILMQKDFIKQDPSRLKLITANKYRGNGMNKIVQSYTQKYIHEFLPGLLKQAKSVKDLSSIVRVAINETQNLMFNDGQLITLNQPEIVNQIGNDVVDAMTDDYVFPATGGAADNMSLKMIVERWKQQPEYKDISFEELLSTAKKEMEAGKVVELEHTDDENQAAKIAADHLTEQINYYSYLHNMESLFSGENVANKELEEPENFVTTFFKDIDIDNINNAKEQEHVCDGSCGGNCQCHTQETLPEIPENTIIPIKPQTVEDKLSNLGENIIVTVVSEPQEMTPLNNDEVKAVDFINNIAASIKR